MSEPTSISSNCPTCGAPLEPGSAGSCPRCLMLAAMEPTSSTGDEARPAPPAQSAVQAAFPQLEILELIGQGGMGCVFKARQPKLNRFVALKLLPASFAERDPAFAGRFEREGQLLARLHHPNIVAVHDSGATGEFFYLIMEYVDGVNLRQAMRSQRFTPAQALSIVPHICDALQFAHDEGVLHRDIKPENILLDGKGRVKLADFGIAKLLAETEPPAAAQAAAPAGITQSGALLGTPSYMAPEQRDTPNDVDNRADIYSLGVVFYELLTGELPRDSFVPPSAASGADPRVDAIVQQALEKQRDRRQRSASEVRTQVTGIGSATSATTPPAKSQHSWHRPALAGALVVLIIVGLIGWMRSRDSEVQARAAERHARIVMLQQQFTAKSQQIADANANAGRAASRAGNSALPDDVRAQAREEEGLHRARAKQAEAELQEMNQRIVAVSSADAGSGAPKFAITFSVVFLMVVVSGVALIVWLVRLGYGKAVLIAGAVLVCLAFAAVFSWVAVRIPRTTPVGVSQKAASMAFPQFLGMGRDNATVLVAHDNANAHYALFHAGKFENSNSSSHNRHGLTWRDGGSIKLSGGRTFSFSRDSVNELFLNINGTEYDLRQGRLFELKNDGTVEQLNANPSLQEARSLDWLVRRVASERRSAEATPEKKAAPATAGMESWSYTPRHITEAKFSEWRTKATSERAEWAKDLTFKYDAGVITLTGPRSVRRVVTMLRVMDQPEVKDALQLPILNMPPDFFLQMTMPGLLLPTDSKKAPFTDGLREALEKEGVALPQLARALSMHVLELEKATYANSGPTLEAISKSPGASTYYDVTIPCADQPDKPLTLRIERTTQQIGTQSNFAGFAPWLIEEAKKQSKEPIDAAGGEKAKEGAGNPPASSLEPSGQ